MPTVPPERTRPADVAPDVRPHEARDVAESFGSDADRYDRSRPRYPEALIERIVAESPGPEMLDVGVGTGIVARQLTAAGCRVLGVDVDARMADAARRHGLDVEVAKFEEWNPSGRTFDAVVSGQTWHWIDPVAGAAKAADVLRPGGRLAVFWNAAQPPRELNEAFMEVYRRVVPEMPASRAPASPLDAYLTLGGRAEDGIRATGAFAEPEEWRFRWERTYTRDEWLDQVPTTGGHSLLPPEKLADVLDGLGAAIDEIGGTFPVTYDVVVITTTRP